MFLTTILIAHIAREIRYTTITNTKMKGIQFSVYFQIRNYRQINRSRNYKNK